MSTYYEVKTIPASKYGNISYEELGITCTYCYAGVKIFESPKGKVSVAEHYNPAVHHVVVEGIVNGEVICKSFEGAYGFWAGCDLVKDLLKTKEVEPTVKPVYEQ